MDGFAHHIQKIGLIADSHGSVSALADAIGALTENGATHFVHLGDFCDSVRHDNLSDVFSLLKTHRVQVVKGNNDYQVEKNLENGYFKKDLPERKHWLDFLKTTPILQVKGRVCFAHSLPFDSIRSFYEPVDTGNTERAADIFKHAGYHVMFCGHCHAPVVFRCKSNGVTRESMPLDASIPIDERERYIFIVGASDAGECGIIDLSNSCYKRIKFKR